MHCCKRDIKTNVNDLRVEGMRPHSLQSSDITCMYPSFAAYSLLECIKGLRKADKQGFNSFSAVN